MVLISLFLILLGASIGSFVNVAALRFLSKDQFTTGRSRCPQCKKTLRWFELIPIISFFILRRRCGTCKNPISIRYLLAEIGMGTFSLLVGSLLIGGSLVTPFYAFLTFGPWVIPLLFALYLTVGSIALFIFLVDLDTQTIPVFATRSLLILGVCVTLLHWILFGDGEIWQVLLVSLSIGAFFVLVWAITRGRGMGLGDAELSLGLGLYLTPLGALGLLLFSFWTGALWALGLMALRGYGPRHRIAFGPFIVVGFCISLFAGRVALPYVLPFQ